MPLRKGPDLPVFGPNLGEQKSNFKSEGSKLKLESQLEKGQTKAFKRSGILLFMVQKSQGQPPADGKKKPVGSGINYLCNISSINSISGGNIKTDIKTLKNRLRWNKHSMFTQIIAEIDQEWYHLNWFPN